MANRGRWDFELTGEALYQELKRAEATAFRELAHEVQAAKNRGFKQVYKRGWERMKALAQKHRSTTPLLVYTTLCEFSGSTSAVVASHSTLAAVLGVSLKSINRACHLLADAGVVRRFRVSKGGAFCYCLNPGEVWGGWRGQQQVAPFHSMTLVSWADQDEATKALIPTLIPPSDAAQAKKAKQAADVERERQRQAQEAAAEAGLPRDKQAEG